MRPRLRATLAVAVGYARHVYDRERFAEFFGDGRSFRDVAPLLATLGAAFGAGCAATTRFAPFPRVAAGAAYGLAVWGGSGAVAHAMLGRPMPWHWTPPLRTATIQASYGAAVAGFIGRHS